MKKMIALAALTSVSLPVIAAETHGYYGSLGGGVYRVDAAGFDDSAPSAMLVGGYSFGRFAAIEAAYSRLFNATDTVDDLKVTIDGDVWDLSTRLSYPVSKRFDPYARLGWSYTELGARATVDNQSLRLNDYDDGFSWAAGTGVRLTPRVLLNVEYSQVLLDDTDLDRVSANVSYRFGAQ